MQVFKHAILQLADNPLYAEAIRAQSEPLVEAEGWTKASLSKMTKLDAFLKESQRFNGSDLCTYFSWLYFPLFFS